MPLPSSLQLAHRARCVRAVTSLHQTRGLRFGRMWSSHLDPEFHHEVCRRTRRVRYKYAETLGRRLSWDKHPLAEETRSALRRMVRNYWDPKGQDLRPGGRFVNMDAQPVAEYTASSVDGVRPGRNIEDVERAPMEHLLFGDKGRPEPYTYDYWQSPLQNIRNKLQSEASSSYSNSGGVGMSEVESDFVIDPITNRKVTKLSGTSSLGNSKGAEIPMKTFKAYRSQFAQPNGDSQHTGQAKEAESDKYKYKKSSSTRGSDRTLSWTSKKVRWHGQIPLGSWSITAETYRNLIDSNNNYKKEAPASSSPQYDDLDKYRPVMGDPAPVDETSRPKYEDLKKYEVDTIEEPDLKPAEDAPATKYNDLGEYGAVQAHEPDGKYKAEETEAEEEVGAAELKKYGPLRSHEPDGKYTVEMGEKEAIDPSELGKYGPLRSHEPDGKYTAEIEGAEEVIDPKELGQYKPVRAHEPDGRYTAEVETALEQDAVDAAELRQYQPVRAHEPDGRYKAEVESVQEEDVVDPEELSKYTAFRAAEPDGKYKAEAEKAEELKAVDPAELSQYEAFRSHEPDGKYAASYLEAEAEAETVHTPEELGKYGPFRSHEPDGKYANQPGGRVDLGAAELGQYQAVRSHEPDGKYAMKNKDSLRSSDEAELETYEGGFASHEPDGLYPNHQGPPSDIPVLKRFEHFESAAPPLVTDLETGELKPYMPHRYAPATAGEDTKADSIKWTKPDGQSKAGDYKAATSPSDPVTGTSYKQMVDSLMAKYTAMSMSDAASRQDMPTVEEQPQQQQQRTEAKPLTGNFVRDFPEEFNRSWSVDNSTSKSSLLPDVMAEQQDAGTGTAHYTAATSTAAIQPALDRYFKPGRRERLASALHSEIETDPYSKAPQGLETSYQEECGGKPTGPAFVKTYEARAVPESESTTAELAPEPTVYKILAYNSTMQSIEVAETTSTVPDTAAPLSPAEVLLRLSNASKFFPHFGPLQAQGFEIVSGSGDVLIFRKVRPATAVAEAPPSQQQAQEQQSQADIPSDTSDAASSSSSSSSFSSPSADAKLTTEADLIFSQGQEQQNGNKPPVNPIDMTGDRVAIGRFASPTGFVNYDLPLGNATASPETEQPQSSPPPPRFISGIDVRREEEVFSGPKEGTYGQGKTARGGKKGRVAKRIAISAVWVGGLSYAAGVVAEYFSTGGVDGRGPKGF